MKTYVMLCTACLLFAGINQQTRAEKTPDWHKMKPKNLGFMKKPYPPSPWVTEDWTGDNKPYREAMESIERELKGAKNLDAIVAKYKRSGEVKPRQPLAVFRWAFATYKVAELKKPYDSYLMWEPSRAMYDTPSPRAYEYARLRFLVESNFYDFYYFLTIKTVGERLLKSNPHDESVKSALCNVLSYGETLQERRKAVSLAKELVAAKRTSAVRWGRLGNMYYGLWMSTQNPADRKGAIAAFKEFIRLGGTDAAALEKTKSLIKLLEKSRDIPRKPASKGAVR